MTQAALNEVFGALADPTRRAILQSLQRKPQPVHRLADGFSMSRPGVSKHLAVLRAAGLVEERKRGRENLYALRRTRLDEARVWLGAFWAGRLSALKDLAEDDDD